MPLILVFAQSVYGEHPASRYKYPARNKGGKDFPNPIKDHVVLWRSLARFFRSIVDAVESLRACKIIQPPFGVRGTCARIIEEALCKLSSKTITGRSNDDTPGGRHFVPKHRASTYKGVYVTVFNIPRALSNLLPYQSVSNDPPLIMNFYCASFIINLLRSMLLP